MFKNYKVWIIIGVLVLALIIFLVWRSSRNKELAAQAERDRLQQQYANTNLPTTASGGGSGLSGTLNSLEGVIDSLAGLFNKNNTNSGNVVGSTSNLQLQYSNECEKLYNTTAQVNACIAQKMQANTIIR